MNDMIPRVHYVFFCCLAFPIPVAAGTLYVDVEARGQNNGTSWTDAYVSLSTAIEKAAVGDEVCVAEGTYAPIVLKNGVKLYGGFVGTESSVSAADPQKHKTYVSGATKSQAVRSIGNESSTILRGFHILNGRASSWSETGGGLYLKDSNAMIVDCVFVNNTADWAGGAVASDYRGSPTFVNCRFLSNGGSESGRTALAGGAVFIRDGEPVFINCLFSGNKASEGGAVVNIAGKVKLVNCTFTDNESTEGKGGALFDDNGFAVADNCIFWNNRAKNSDTNEIHNNHSRGTSRVTYSVVKGAWPGTGNIGSDPLFVDAGKGDYRLQEGSPCRDTGASGALPQDVGDIGLDGNTTEVLPKDLALKPRIHGDSVDIGAFEWHPPNN